MAKPKNPVHPVKQDAAAFRAAVDKLAVALREATVAARALSHDVTVVEGIAPETMKLNFMCEHMADEVDFLLDNLAKLDATASAAHEKATLAMAEAAAAADSKSAEPAARPAVVPPNITPVPQADGDSRDLDTAEPAVVEKGTAVASKRSE